MNLNSQNILGNSEKIETDNMHEKENIFDSKISNQNEQKQSLFSKLFKKKTNKINSYLFTHNKVTKINVDNRDTTRKFYKR